MTGDPAALLAAAALALACADGLALAVLCWLVRRQDRRQATALADACHEFEVSFRFLKDRLPPAPAPSKRRPRT